MTKPGCIIAFLAALAAVSALGCGAQLNPKTGQHIAAALQGQTQAFHSCYEAALQRNRELAGNMALKLDIDAKGRVKSAKVEKTEIQDEQMQSCVSSVASGITLSEPPHVPVEGHYAVDFRLQ